MRQPYRSVWTELLDTPFRQAWIDAGGLKTLCPGRRSFKSAAGLDAWYGREPGKPRRQPFNRAFTHLSAARPASRFEMASLCGPFKLRGFPTVHTALNTNCCTRTSRSLAPSVRPAYSFSDSRVGVAAAARASLRTFNRTPSRSGNREERCAPQTDAPKLADPALSEAARKRVKRDGSSDNDHAFDKRLNI
jgi:hypothetical protein